jgi:hypothetical protein
MRTREQEAQTFSHPSSPPLLLQFFDRATEARPSQQRRQETMSKRSNSLAERLEQGVRSLWTFAGGLTDAEWKTPIAHDWRTVGIVVHHVASIMPLEIDLAMTVAKGNPVVGLTWDTVHQINAEHARANPDVGREEALDLLRKNADDAAAAIRALNDADLDRALPVSMYSDAPLTTQFLLEDHAVRHAYHHLAKIRGALKR